MGWTYCRHSRSTISWWMGAMLFSALFWGFWALNFYDSLHRTHNKQTKPFGDIEFHSINLSSTLLYRTENFVREGKGRRKAFHRQRRRWIVECCVRCESSVQFIPLFLSCRVWQIYTFHISPSLLFVMTSCFICHIIVVDIGESDENPAVHLTTRGWNIDFGRWRRWMRRNYQKNFIDETRRKSCRGKFLPDADEDDVWREFRARRKSFLGSCKHFNHFLSTTSSVGSKLCLALIPTWKIILRSLHEKSANFRSFRFLHWSYQSIIIYYRRECLICVPMPFGGFIFFFFGFSRRVWGSCLVCNLHFSTP